MFLSKLKHSAPFKPVRCSANGPSQRLVIIGNFGLTLILSIPQVSSSNLSTFFLDEGKATTIMAEIYVESFGNIEEANMVGNLHVTYTVVANAILLFQFYCLFLWLVPHILQLLP